MRKFGFGIIWFIALVLIITTVGAFIAGILAAAVDPENGRALGREAGRRYWDNYGLLILLSAFVISIIGSVFGWLPGTKSKTSS